MSNIVELKCDSLYWINFYVTNIKTLLNKTTMTYEVVKSIEGHFEGIEMHLKLLKNREDKSEI